MRSEVCRQKLTSSPEWSKKGIVGRGVLLDYESWRLKRGIASEAFKATEITVDTLKSIAESQGTEIKFGDILLVRTGMFHILSIKIDKH